MTIPAAAIIKTLNQLLTKQIGTTRIIETPGGADLVRTGHAPHTAQAMSKQTFEITLDSMGRNESTPVSAIGSHRLDDLLVTIECHHKFKSKIQVAERRDVLAEALYDADVIMQALGYPNNIATTSSGTATNIISGMLLDLDRDVILEDWDNSVLVTAISGRAIVRISQLTPGG